MPKNNAAQITPADAYPQMLERQAVQRALKTLSSPRTAELAARAVQGCVAPMRAAIMGYVAELEAAGADMAGVHAAVHEIRGFAETAGLVTTGRIADILCRYMDDMERAAKPLDGHIVTLHVAAIARAARTEEDDAAMGDVVAAELAALVARRLAGR
jgi:histone H3/H4